ncbi:MAG: DUF2235 domain-containing protein [Pseudomonadota bacterium]
MSLSPLNDRLAGWFGRKGGAPSGTPAGDQTVRTHVIVLDGTMSSLKPGQETNAGLVYRLCQEIGAPVMVYYAPGVQWPDWSATLNVMRGKGTGRMIRQAYGYLASRYRPGDRIYLFGFSRGAFAARSLAGVIDLVGLLRPDAATHRNVRLAYRHYELNPFGHTAAAFSRQFCYPHGAVEIEMVGVWDTVKALGLRVPILWRFLPNRHAYHSDILGPSVKAGFHALALDETRLAYEPVLWTTPPGWTGRVEQVWFAGTHGDVGGQLNGLMDVRKRSNIALVWMLERAEETGLVLPEGWRDRFPCDPDAPSVGRWRGWAKTMVLRGPRHVGRDRSERLHETVPPRAPEPDGWSDRLSALWSAVRGSI